jgi:hypothetical protein
MAARAQMGMNNSILARFSAAVLPHLCEESRLGRLQNPPPLLSTASPVRMTHAGQNLPRPPDYHTRRRPTTTNEPSEEFSPRLFLSFF